MTIAMAGVGVAIGLLVLCWRIGRMEERRRVHVLQKPLKIASGSSTHGYYLLPAGTTLYFDQAMPEGFSRYYVYFNVEGEPLRLTEEERPGLIDPLTAYPIDKEELISLLDQYPLSKEDLARILQSISATRQDIIEILNTHKEP
jgi:hypothetical protein